MLDQPPSRAVAIGVLLVAGCGLFVWYGALAPAPAVHDYPGDGELITEYDAYVGQQAEVSGTVVATDPVVIDVEDAGATERFTVREAPPVEEGQQLSVFATVEPDGTLTAHEAAVRDGWEPLYMYAVSFLAAGWLAVRLAVHWRVDCRVLALVPRGTAPDEPATSDESGPMPSEGTRHG